MLSHDDDDEKWLAEGIAGIQHNAFYMQRPLGANDLKNTLRYSVQMLSVLRTSLLFSHKYYELCELGYLFDLACSECCLCRSWILMCFFSGTRKICRPFKYFQRVFNFFRYTAQYASVCTISSKYRYAGTGRNCEPCLDYCKIVGLKLHHLSFVLYI
ncbi:hypothetical protein B296_00054085 [Ensete ventricosum]|uniref:Uncharacterized protein n=1 Tax=Ensete ventricosum TaxID=4639 RepID=A0A426XZT9_ENSVE|nr:hypothetical protein B296_00054085 [Ensete ventricosum]